MQTQIETITRQFIGNLEAAIEERTMSKVARAVVLMGMDAPAARSAGRPPEKARKKPPLQLCPVPGCSQRAAPVFGMVCSAHKGVAKSKIRKYREARRAAKAKRG